MCAWVPPPPGNRAFYSFVSPPRLELTARPEVSSPAAACLHACLPACRALPAGLPRYACSSWDVPTAQLSQRRARRPGALLTSAC